MVQQQLGFYEQGKVNYLEDARAVAKRLLRDRTSITTDDIWQHCPPPKFLNTKIMGQIFRGGQFEQTGQWEKSRRPTSHGRAVFHYRLKSNDHIPVVPQVS